MRVEHRCGDAEVPGQAVSQLGLASSSAKTVVIPSRADQLLELAQVRWGRLGVRGEAGDAHDVEAVAAS